MPRPQPSPRGGGDLEAGSSSASGVTFRPLHKDDVVELMTLQRALFPVQYGDSFYEKLFTPGHYCLVGLTDEGELVAVASARVVDGEKPDDAQEAYIMTLGVKESHRRLGLGTRAMNEILSLMTRETTCAYAALHVKALNKAAVRFYEAHGFECDPIHGVLRRHYWIDNEWWDAYRYTRRLRKPPLFSFIHDLCSIL